MLQIGDPLPDFAIPLARADGTKDRVSARSLWADGPLVLAFYPVAFTGVCSDQVCELRDAVAGLSALDATVVGFSIDTWAANVAFARAHELPYGLYSDANREVVETIWETMSVVGIDRVAKRGYLVVDGHGIVRAKWLTDDADEWLGLKAIETALIDLKNR